MTAEAIEARKNFITTLEETAEIAGASGQKAAQGILYCLLSAMLTGRELELLNHTCEFTQREVERLKRGL